MAFGKRQPAGAAPVIERRLRPRTTAVQPIIGSHDHGFPVSPQSRLDSLNAAGMEIAQHLTAYYRHHQPDFRWEAVLGAVAALTGEFALRASAGTRLPDRDAWIEGAPADPLMFSGSEPLWPMVIAGALAAGLQREQLPDLAQIARRADAMLGKSPFPPLSIPKQHYPGEWSPNACVLHREAIIKCADSYGVKDALDLSLALAFACAFLISAACETVPAQTSTLLVAEVMVGVARIVPLQERR